MKLKIPGKAFWKSESRTSVILQFLTLAIYQWQKFGTALSDDISYHLFLNFFVRRESTIVTIFKTKRSDKIKNDET